MSEPADSQMQITANMTGLINFGVFKLKILLINRAFRSDRRNNSANGTRWIITTHFHRSLDGARAINYGLWSSQEVYAR